jgi:hypothetical protein
MATLKKASYLAGKSKTELIEDVKILFLLTCVLAFSLGFAMGYLI